MTVVGLNEICSILNVTRATASKYALRRDFPQPVANLDRGRVWNRKEVEAWGKTHLPLPTGRPKREEA